jgi:hypothetical protein
LVKKGKPEDTETGLYSRGKKGYRRHKQYDDSKSSADEGPLCYKCDEIGHISTTCLYRRAINKLVRKLQGRDNKDGHSKARKEVAAAALASRGDSDSESSCDECGRALLTKELITA